MMRWESGRESRWLDEIIAGRKAVEGRLNKGKFVEYKVGDTVSLRRDFRNEVGELIDGEPNAATVEIIAIRRYESFLEMLRAEGIENVLPGYETIEAGAAEYERYYSKEDQEKYGVLAVEVKRYGN